MSPEIQTWYEEYQRRQQALRDEARAEALQRGRQAGERALLLRLLRTRFGDLPEAIEERVGAAESEQIEQWGERVLFASTLDQVFAEHT